MSSKFTDQDYHRYIVNKKAPPKPKLHKALQLGSKGWQHLLTVIPRMRNGLDMLEPFGGPKDSIVITFPNADFRNL